MNSAPEEREPRSASFPAVGEWPVASTRRTPILFFTIVVSLGLSFVISSAPKALTVMLNSHDRARLLKSTCETSSIIVDCTIEDAYPYSAEDGIRTLYRLHINRVFKGTMPVDSTLSLSEPGGVMSDRGRYVEDVPTYPIGASYIMFLGYCDDTADYHTVSYACAARTESDSATTGYPARKVYTPAFLDSVSGFIAPCSYAYQVHASHLAVIGRILDLPSNPSYARPLSLHARINAVLSQRQGPAVSAGEVITVIAPAIRGPGTAAGSRSEFVADAESLLLLTYADGQWRLSPCAYSTWERAGAVGLVRVRAPQCNAAYEIASESWDSLQTGAAE